MLVGVNWVTEVHDRPLEDSAAMRAATTSFKRGCSSSCAAVGRLAGSGSIMCRTTARKSSL